jgi:formate dehydrogenase maturation protein FdhE
LPCQATKLRSLLLSPLIGAAPFSQTTNNKKRAAILTPMRLLALQTSNHAMPMLSQLLLAADAAVGHAGAIAAIAALDAAKRAVPTQFAQHLNSNTLQQHQLQPATLLSAAIACSRRHSVDSGDVFDPSYGPLSLRLPLISLFSAF